MTIFGIDLGTSNSVISYWDGAEVKMIPNQHDNILTPSVVSIDENNEILIGEVAKERLFSHPEKTAATFKRFMGTEKKFQLGERFYTPIELSALVLTSLKQSAESYLAEPCEEVVISVPAYFNNAQRESTLEAARLAGLTVKSLISEPTAAAIAYGVTEKPESQILVLDLGGGTFDVSLLDLFEGVIQVEAISGDNFLGGEDFTQVLIHDFLRKNDLESSQLSPQEQGQLYRKMEAAKLQLSGEVSVALKSTVAGEAYDYTLTPEQYQQLCEGLLNRLKLPILRVLRDAHLQVAEIDQVILVGGATKSKQLRQFFARLFKKFPSVQLNPDQTISYGASLRGVLRNEQFKEEVVLTDVCGFSMGTEIVRRTQQGLIGDIYDPIIERNTTIPVSIMKSFYTMTEGQEQMDFTIYQGENPRASDNLKIGELTIKLPPNQGIGYQIDCRFTYDNNGILEVILVDPATKEQKELIIEENPGKLTPLEIKASLAKLAGLKIMPAEKAENRLLLARLERIYAEATGPYRSQVSELIADFRGLLQSQDLPAIEKAHREYSRIVDQLERELLL